MSSSSVFFPQLLSTHIRCFPSSNSNSSLISPASHILPGSHFNLRCLWKIIIIDCSAVAHQPTHAGTPTPNYSERNKNSEIAKRKQEKIDSKYINTHDKNTSPFWQSQRKKKTKVCFVCLCKSAVLRYQRQRKEPWMWIRVTDSEWFECVCANKTDISIKEHSLVTLDIFYIWKQLHKKVVFVLVRAACYHTSGTAPVIAFFPPFIPNFSSRCFLFSSLPGWHLAPLH